MEELAKKLEPLSGDGMKLESLSNRGMKVWPGGHKETFTVDSTACRFQLPEGKGSVSHSAVVKLLERVTQAGVECVKTEGLYNFDGKAGFAKG
jgi:isocitrate dehydrogenase